MTASPASDTLEFSRLGRRVERPVIVELMARALAEPDLLSLAAGFTDNAVLPKALVARAAAELTRTGIADEPLQYGPNQGRAGLRRLTCEWMEGHPGERAGAYDPEAVFLTNGSQQALYLAMQTICDPGDIVLVEDPSYFVCLEMLKGLGLRAIGIPCDASGAMRPGALAETLARLDRAGERARVKALYLVSYFGNPSSRSMTLAEKKGVAAELEAADFNIPVIEDGAYRELYFDAPHPVPSILSLPEFADFPRLYLGTYTKPFATGLKVGYGICSHPGWRDKMLGVKGHQDFGSSHFNQALVEWVVASGDYAAHLERVRPHYASKSAALQGALEAGGLLEAGWAWERPQGGLIFWMRAPEELDVGIGGRFCERCIERGVLYVPGDLCFATDPRRNCLRLSVGAIPADRLEEAAERFAAVAQAFA